MPEMHSQRLVLLGKPEFNYKESIIKFKETGDSRYIYESQLDKACFQHDMGSGICLEEHFI